MNDIRIVVTIGTDHHQFTRLVDWLDRWLESRPELVDATLVQHGQSRPSRLARNVAFVEYEQLLVLMAQADAIITHGGPATLFEARRQGRRPICVPRDPARDEHVDEHQQRFARHVAAAGLVTLCEDEKAFGAALERLVDDPRCGDVVDDGDRLSTTMTNLDDIVRTLTAERVRARSAATARRDG